MPSVLSANIGAANTLTFQPDGKILADNTDGIGFINNLKQSAPNWNPSRGPALVLGAGGAARAILWSLMEEGTPEIFLANRTKERAEALSAEFGQKIKPIDWSEIPEAIKLTATIVNTTSLGMTGQPELNISVATAPSHALVTDIV